MNVKLTLAAFLSIICITVRAQTSTVLSSLNATNGGNPEGGMVLSSNVLYGTTYSSGSYNEGMLFKINTDGSGFSNLYSFSVSQGAYPMGTLIFDGNTTLYGTCSSGGSSMIYGVVFKIATDGTGYTVLKNFNATDGSAPYGGLVLNSNVLYGTTYYAGSSGGGVVFKMNTDGTGYTVLRNLNPATDGSRPMTTLTYSSNVLYGTTDVGGTWNDGTVFKVNTDGSGFAVLNYFNQTNGQNPQGSMVLSGNTLYGTTYFGGAHGNGTIFAINTDGTGFSVLRSLDFINDGASPQQTLILAGDRLFGTTKLELFKINLDGTGFAVLNKFASDVGYVNTPTDPILGDSTIYATFKNGGDTLNGAVWKYDLRPQLFQQWSNNQFILSWTNNFFGLQCASSVAGPFTNLPAASNPFTNSIADPSAFFRLIMN